MKKIWMIDGQFKKLNHEQIESLDESELKAYQNALYANIEEKEAALETTIAALKEKGDGNSEELASLKSELAGVSAESVKMLMKAVKEQGIEMNKIIKGGVAGAVTKSELITFLEKDKSEAVKAKKTGFDSIAVDSALLVKTMIGKAAALMTTANVVPNATDGFNQLFGNYIDPTIYSTPKPENFIMGLVDTQLAAGTENLYYVDRINEEGDAAFIGEGELKPLIDAEWKQSKAEIKEVAERWKQSIRLINHAPTSVTDFRQHAQELIENKMDDGVLIGDGTGNNLNGIATLASPFVVPPALANFYESANIWDAINAIATYVRLNNFKGQLTCVLNTVWEAKMKGYKNANGDYIIPPFVAPDGTKVGSVNVTFQNKMPDDKILLGDLKMFKVRIAEDITYAEGWENDDFSKNLVSKRLDAFLGTYLPTSNAGAIVYDDIATVLTAIEVVPVP